MTGTGVTAAVRHLPTVAGARMAAGLSDGQLLEGFVARGEGAYLEALVLRHGPMVWGVCRRALRDHHDAEDAFQATFLVLARKAESIWPRERVGNWLYGVAYQTAWKARATRARRRMREAEAAAAPGPVAAPAGRDDLAEVLDHELRQLPDKYRTPIVLCELEGKTHGEAAEQLGWPVGTVSGRLSRARAMLARRLTRRGVATSCAALAGALAQSTASAGVPAPLLASTVQAASLFAAGPAATAGALSAQVAALTQEVLKSMLISRIKFTTAVTTAALLAFALTGAGLWQVRTWADERAPSAGPSAAAIDEGSGKALPAGSFRVTVNEVINDDSTLVTQIGIETLPGSTVELIPDKDGADVKGLKASTSTSPPGRPDAPSVIQLTLLGDQVEWKGSSTRAVKFLLAYKVGKISSSISEAGPMPANARRLADVLKVPIKPGQYRYGRAAKLVTFKGVTYTLVVNRPK